MLVHAIRLYKFRNLHDGVLEFSPGLNLFTGRNGQGKTNLVEALALLSMGKSFRTTKLSELIAWGEESASVYADAKLETGDVRLGCVLHRSSKDHGSRETFVNENRVPLTEFVGKLLCVSFSPTDIEIIRGAPISRRRFLDKHLVDWEPHSLKHLLHYNQALRSKNALLRDGLRDAAALDPWNEILAIEGKAIFDARIRFISELEEKLKRIHGSFAQADGEAELSLKSDLKNLSLDEIRSELQREKSREIALRSAAFGIHRDDLKIFLTDKSSRQFASQGQSKSLAVSLKLSVIELLEEKRKEAPLVVLDDVDSELDRVRAQALYELILSGSRQAFVTATEPGGFLKDRAAQFLEMSMQNGAVSKTVR